MHFSICASTLICSFLNNEFASSCNFFIGKFRGGNPSIGKFYGGDSSNGPLVAFNFYYLLTTYQPFTPEHQVHISLRLCIVKFVCVWYRLYDFSFNCIHNMCMNVRITREEVKKAQGNENLYSTIVATHSYHPMYKQEKRKNPLVFTYFVKNQLGCWIKPNATLPYGQEVLIWCKYAWWVIRHAIHTSLYTIAPV